MEVLPCSFCSGFPLDSRISAALALYAFLILGVFLLVAPWTPVWQQATLLWAPTRWAQWLRGGSVRGLVSGLGAVDLVVALQLAAELWKGSGAGRGPGTGPVSGSK